MIHKLWVRITFYLLILISVILLVSGLFISEKMKKTYYDIESNHLLESAYLVADFLGIPETSNELQDKIMKVEDSIHSRITIINKDGVVLADSEEDPNKMENHKNRPEIKEVLEGDGESFAIRFSDTLGYDMMYVTIPIQDNGETHGVIRISRSLDAIDQSISRLWRSIALFTVTLFVLSGIIGIRLAKGFTKPIEEIIEVSENLSEKIYTEKVKNIPKGELGQLAEAINALARNLRNQMNQIQENEQLLYGVITNMTSGVLLVDRSGKILIANRAVSEIIDVDRRELENKKFVEVVRNTELVNLVEHCMQSRAKVRQEIQFYQPKERIIDAYLAPYVHEQKGMKGIIAVLHDVTDLRKLEVIRSEFVANVSHELKTPVTSVKGFTETLLDGAMEDPDLLKEFLQIIHKESDRLHRLIQDLLYLSQIEQHRTPLNVEIFNLTDSIRTTTEAVLKKAEKKQQKVSFKLEDDLWIEGDKGRIEQVAVNLIANAIAYTPEKGEITVSIWEEKNKVFLRVSDTGIGISATDLPRIFERFYRVDKARSRNSGGTGLGLAIVKHLIESHNGNIAVNSVEGAGTTFTVTLPKKQKPIRT